MPKIEDDEDAAFDAMFDGPPNRWSEEDEREYRKELEGMTPEQLEALSEVENAAREYKRCRDNVKALEDAQKIKPAPQREWRN